MAPSFPTLSVENDPSEMSSEIMTKVDGKWYPQELRRWDDFEDEHDRINNLWNRCPLSSFFLRKSKS